MRFFYYCPSCPATVCVCVCTCVYVCVVCERLKSISPSLACLPLILSDLLWLSFLNLPLLFVSCSGVDVQAEVREEKQIDR